MPILNKPLLLGLGFLGGAAAGYAAHDEIKKNVGYGSYLIPHKYWVYRAMRQEGLPIGQSLKHDLSKFTPGEWMPYASWFNGPQGLHGTKDKKVYLEWRKAVEKHYSRNPHHWRALHKTPAETPLEYKLEAIADWYGVQRAKGQTKKSFKNWFEERKHTFPIDKPTVEEAEKRLKIAETKLALSPELALRASSRATDAANKFVVKAEPHIGGNQLQFQKFMSPAKKKVQQGKKFLNYALDKHQEAINDLKALNKTGEKNNKYTSLEYTIASGDPFVKALTRRMPPDKQKAVWRRYAQIVLRNRNYGRRGQVPGEYIKLKDRDHE